MLVILLFKMAYLVSYIQEGGDEPNGVLDELHSSMNFSAVTMSSMLSIYQIRCL